jgi:hypothetical protein
VRREAFLGGLLCALAAVAGETALAAGETPDAGPLISINHVPLAVKDVDRAAQMYRRLGFVIKPGRFHADGIRTQLIKFPHDGAGIELITAARATDPLTAHYLRLLSEGEGPAYVCFTTPDLGGIKQRLEQLGEVYSLDDGLLTLTEPPLNWLFLAEGPNLSPTDRPEHFAHANTANAALAIWIAGGDQKRMLAFFKALGARIERERVHAPDPLLADIARVDKGGQVIFLPASHQIIPGWPIVGIVMRVKDLSATRQALKSGGIRPVQRPDVGYGSVLVAPNDTHNMWLEFRE